MNIMRTYNDFLFSKYNLREVIESQETKIQSEIDNYERNYILNVSVEDLIEHLISKYAIEPIIFNKERAYIKRQGEAQIDVSQDLRRVFIDRSGPSYIKGTSVTFAIPFEGDSKLFHCQASSFNLSPPIANINSNEVIIVFEEVDPEPEKLKSEFERSLAGIEKQVGWINNDLMPFNNGLRDKIKQKITVRKEKLLKDQGIVAALGYPVKESSDLPKTYTVPTVKKNIVIPKPDATTDPFIPEPSLDMGIYESILKIISDMVLVMERSPHAFKDMDEEALRQHFLVQLNGHFQGEATGETFNYTGKTDILIRANDKNIFIAECMFWKGQKSLTEKINQLLGYISWRDTKTAILIFNRNKEFSKVVEQIPETVKQHKNYKRQVEYKSETGYRFMLHQEGDKNREIILTFLAFNIPK